MDAGNLPAPKHSFPKSARLVQRSEFERVSRQGIRRSGQWIAVEVRVRPGATLPARLGITASRKFGKSHDRNRFKRLVRESFRLIRRQLLAGLEINVRPRYRPDRTPTLDEIQKELLQLCAMG